MVDSSRAFSGFSVDDVDAAERFYVDVLGLDATREAPLMLRLRLASGASVLLYGKAGHAPASFTVLNFPVADVDSEVDGLVARGVAMERYDGMPQDERGIMRGNGPTIAWFTDPAGNVLSVVAED